MNELLCKDYLTILLLRDKTDTLKIIADMFFGIDAFLQYVLLVLKLKLRQNERSMCYDSLWLVDSIWEQKEL